MAYAIRIPRLGWSMEEGTFVRWLKAPGDRVKPSEPLFELEGEKSVEPVESIDGGLLHVPAGAPGEGAVVKVGTLIGWLLADGEAPPAYAPEVPQAPAAAPAAASPAPAATATGAAAAFGAPPTASTGAVATADVKDGNGLRKSTTVTTTNRCSAHAAMAVPASA